MKRYQCIKNYDIGENRLFKAGSLYTFFTIENTDLTGVIDDQGIERIVYEDTASYFQELLDLHVDDEDHDANEYSRFLETKGFARGCAWGIVVLSVVGVFIYKAIIWNS